MFRESTNLNKMLSVIDYDACLVFQGYFSPFLYSEPCIFSGSLA